MTARPIRYQRQVSDRNGKIFYTSIASLSHINKFNGIIAKPSSDLTTTITGGLFPWNTLTQTGLN